MNNITNIDELALELNGIKDTLFLLAKSFDNIDRPADVSNEIVSGTLHTIAMHVERITNDLDNIYIPEKA